ncbi:MAG: hypothetical protein EAZ43_02260 [Betaproteobacteria bacterium]|nr:MAG: hypothetical protein EAZ43_02260 [Betaproteobacteria bacterium]
MNAWIQRLLWVAGLVVALTAVNVTIAGHEKTLAKGRVVLLQLAPVDPRSLMQGDYMALRFEVATPILNAATEAKLLDGYAVLTIDGNGVGTFSRLFTPGETLADNAQKLQFRTRNNGIRIVTDAYFFQEGTGDSFEAAKFGQFRVNADGTALLVAMLDADRRVIEPKLKLRNDDQSKGGVEVRG